MGGLSDRIAALEEAANAGRREVVFNGPPEEATAAYLRWRSTPLAHDAPNPFEGLTDSQAIARYLELIGARPVPRGRG